MVSPILMSIRAVRRLLIDIAIAKKEAPSDNAVRRLMELVPQFNRIELDDKLFSQIWGEMQILMIECEGRKEDTQHWSKIRNAANVAMVALLRRKELEDLLPVFARDIFPRLAGAVNSPRSARMQACIEITTKMRQLSGRKSAEKHSWLLRQISEMQYPRFGTSGWRARMGEDFNWHRATCVAQAIVEFVIESGVGRHPLTIGCDSRINADRVAALVAEVAISNGLNVHLASRETPSPALIYYITEQLGVATNAGLINCTPSHNPVKDPAKRAYVGTEYHGIRYNMPYGGVAPSRATDAIGRRAMELMLMDEVVPSDKQRGHVVMFDTLDNYTNAAISDLDIKVNVPSGQANALELMRSFWGSSDAMVVIDEMHSASRGYLRKVCEKLGINYTVIHGEKDPLLGELMYANPEQPHIRHCQDKVRELRGTYPRIIGLGFDTDSDRFGVVDDNGNYVLMNNVLTMLADYLLTAGYNGQPGFIIRNMVTTRLLDRVAEKNSDKIIPPADINAVIPHAAGASYTVALGDASKQSGFLTHVVPVGFKFIADVMMAGLQQIVADGETDPKKIQASFKSCLGKLMIAGEESNGMTSRNHTPDKDGLWGALLTLQMCAVLNKTLGNRWDDITEKYGKLVSVRRDVEAPDAAKEAVVNVYLDRYADMTRSIIMQDPDLCYLTPVYCGGVRGELVEVILKSDDGSESYLAIRASGTEPINRIYIEAQTEEMRDFIKLAVGDELERQILNAIDSSIDVSGVIDILETVELPHEGNAMPATFTASIINPAKEKIRKMGGDLKTADAELGVRNAAKVGALLKSEN
jgi:phosphomannomutase